MPTFIFLCDMATERECLDRKLFGTNPGDMHKFHYSRVAIGDTLFQAELPVAGAGGRRWSQQDAAERG